MQKEIETIRAELTGLETDTPKFIALLEQHQAGAIAARGEAVNATKTGSLETAAKHLAKAAALEGQAAAVRSMLEQHRAEINAVQSRIGDLEAQAERAQLLARIASVARAADAEARAIEAETQKALEHLAALTQKVIQHRIAWNEQSLEWNALLPALGVVPPHLINERDPKRTHALHTAHRMFVAELEAAGVPTEAVRTPFTRLQDTPYRMQEIDPSDPSNAAKIALKGFFPALQLVQDHQELRQK
jgi:hypothetical protein